MQLDLFRIDFINMIEIRFDMNNFIKREFIQNLFDFLQLLLFYNYFIVILF